MHTTEDPKAVQESPTNHAFFFVTGQGDNQVKKGKPKKITPAEGLIAHQPGSMRANSHQTGEITHEMVLSVFRSKTYVRTSDSYRNRLSACGMTDPVVGQRGLIVRVYEDSPGDGYKCDVMWESGLGLTGYQTKECNTDLAIVAASGTANGENLTSPLRISDVVPNCPAVYLDAAVGYVGTKLNTAPAGGPSLWSEKGLWEKKVDAVPAADRRRSSVPANIGAGQSGEALEDIFNHLQTATPMKTQGPYSSPPQLNLPQLAGPAHQSGSQLPQFNAPSPAAAGGYKLPSEAGAQAPSANPPVLQQFTPSKPRPRAESQPDTSVGLDCPSAAYPLHSAASSVSGPPSGTAVAHAMAKYRLPGAVGNSPKSDGRKTPIQEATIPDGYKEVCGAPTQEVVAPNGIKENRQGSPTDTTHNFMC